MTALRKIHFTVFLWAAAVWAAESGPALHAAATEPPPSLEAWIPEDAVGFVKVRDLANRLEAFLDSRFFAEIRKSALWAALERDEKFRNFESELERFERTGGRSIPALVRDVLGREAILALRFTLEGPEVILLARGEGEEGLDRFFRVLERVLTERLGYVPRGEKRVYGGTAIEAFENLAYARLGGVLAVSNRPAGIESVIDLAAGQGGKSLAEASAFGKVLGATDAFASAAVRPRFLPDFRVPERLDNALGSLLFGGWVEAARASDLLAAAIRHDGKRFVFDIEARLDPDGLRPAAKAFAPAEPGGSVALRLAGSGVLAVIEVQRDFAEWWRRAEDLCEPGAAGGLQQFAQVMSIVFGGRSFEDEVLPEFGRTATLVLKNREFPPGTEPPKPLLPGIALVAELRDAKRFAPDLEAAFQSLIGIINVDRAQKKKDAPLMLVRTEDVGGVQLVRADLRQREGGVRAQGIEANFEPSLAVAGNYVILASASDTARFLIRELSKESRRRAKRRSLDLLAVDAGELAKILRANVPFLAAARMAKEGLSLDDARREVEAFIELVPLIGDVQWTAGFTGRDTFRVRLRAGESRAAERRARERARF